jgi:hypothetical protein
MSIWPCEIAAAEAIARGICSPYHVDKRGKLKPTLIGRHTIAMKFR